MVKHVSGMSKRCLASLALCAATATVPLTSMAQSSTCGSALAQLQHYVAQVNAFANYEFYTGIPSRCYGNPNCGGWLLNQLNGWYMQQSAMVNNWYAQISRACSSSAQGRRVPVRRPTADDPGEIDESAVSDLRVDDEDRAVAIRIPSNPQGFRR